jgi:hypothetical protein
VITLRHRKSGPALIALLGAALACFLAGPSVASASNVDCWGGVGPTASNQTELTYAFTCSDEIKGFSFVSSLEVGDFSTTADVFDPTTKQPVSGQSFNCEGPIPGDGFGCTGDANPNLITGTLGVDQPRCVKRRNQLRAWIVATDSTGSETGPFALAVPRCPKKVTRAGHHKVSHARHHKR